MDHGHNRYELLFMDDDDVGNDTLDNIVPKSKKQTKQTTTTSNVASKPSKQNANKKSGAEKENKPANLNKNNNQEVASKKFGAADKFNKQSGAANGANANNNNNNNSNNINRKRNAPATGTTTTGNYNNGPGKQQQTTETREQRNNRRNLRENGVAAHGESIGTNSGNSGSGAGGRRDNNRNFGQTRNNRNFEGGNNRKREFDRQSGNDRTGLKGVEKRDGGGAHNWGGSTKEVVADETNGNNKNELEDKTEETTNNNNETGNEIATTEPTTVEEETKELTLDEWKAKKGQRVKPTFNIRKAGEGEDTSQWKKMIVLNNNKKKENESEEELEFDPAMYPQRVGRQQRVLDIQFNFNDGRRGGPGFGGRGRGGPRGPRQGVNRTESTINGNGPNTVGERPPRGNFNNRGSNAGNVGGAEGGRRHYAGERHQQQHAPKVNDERQFPTLS